MICIEALFNTSSQEIRKTISHRIANLLGKTIELRSDFYNEMLKLYKIRNDLEDKRK
jgi:hypothetical protein